MSDKTSDRVTSGIPGLDNLIEGGFVKGSVILLSGGTGTGKTIFSVQYLLEGLKKGENCLFITLEQKPEEIVGDVKGFGWDLEKYIKSGNLTISYYDPFQITDIVTPLIDAVKSKKISRVVIDSTSVMGLYFKDEFSVRKQLFKLLTGLKSVDITTIITSELPEDIKRLSRFGVEEFITDGVVILYFLGIGGQTGSSIQVRKMRRTNHSKDYHPLEITNKGIKIKKEGTSTMLR